MTAVVLALPVQPRPVALRAERDAIERRQWADVLRLAEIRAELAAITEEGLLDA